MYLLDTNACVEYLRGKNALLLQRLASKPVVDIQLCSVVLAELYIGALRSAQPSANRTKIDNFAQPYACLPFDLLAADVHARIRHHLESLGMPIGPYDSQIAAIALANGLTVVTHNTIEFNRVPGLKIEDWEIP
ncbi:MAG: type II toxin-antitoxin system VapC family toxin [Gemmataceae bacterium]|nr:type II toxin-antitoxin system VapC family toxin [Gemmataceae bacterium]